jgi:hypothetical protein
MDTVMAGVAAAAGFFAADRRVEAAVFRSLPHLHPLRSGQKPHSALKTGA